MNSPNLKTFFRNIMGGIPTSIDLTEVNKETAGPLEDALSLIQQVRTKETGVAAAELEALINQIHMISGEYHP
jgi:hypothetical protein